MITNIYPIEIITPCFCAGADQGKAEIRPSSIRGQLRWWFRALGGNKEEETIVFGSTAGGSGLSSAIQLRVEAVTRGETWTPPRVNPNDPMAYVYHFASVSGSPKGVRWTANGNIPPGSRFKLHIRRARLIKPKLESNFQLALKCFLMLGGIGLRVTRGLGAFSCSCNEFQLNNESIGALKKNLDEHGFNFIEKSKPMTFWEDAIRQAGYILKEELRKKYPAGKNGSSPTPLGSSTPRQTSSVYFRPIKREGGVYGLCLFEAPPDRVLDHRSREGAPILNRVFSGE